MNFVVCEIIIEKSGIQSFVSRIPDQQVHGTVLCLDLFKVLSLDGISVVNLKKCFKKNSS